MQELLNAIKHLQETRKLSDRKFAKSLGIDNSTWSLVIRGKKSPGMKVLSAIARVYPELNTLIIQAMSEKKQAIKD